MPISRSIQTQMPVGALIGEIDHGVTLTRNRSALDVTPPGPVRRPRPPTTPAWGCGPIAEAEAGPCPRSAASVREISHPECPAVGYHVSPWERYTLRMPAPCRAPSGETS